MYQPWIFGATMIGGCVLIALTATRGNPGAPEPSLEPSPESVRVIPPNAPTWVPEPRITTIDLPEVVITAAAPAARRKALVSERELHACSIWRTIGPAYVDSAGNPSGERKVRELCD